MFDTDFVEFRKIPRLFRPCTITEKIDGTNGVVYVYDAAMTIGEDISTKFPFIVPVPESTLRIVPGSKSRWISLVDDNYGFARWVTLNAKELGKLGVGRHYGEWWGSKINRSYGLKGGVKYFSLFNTHRWNVYNVPSCCSVVPVLYHGIFTTNAVDECVELLRREGSQINEVRGFERPEGIVVFHDAANSYFKKTLEKDDKPKGMSNDE